MKKGKIRVVLLLFLVALCLSVGCAKFVKGPKFLEGIITETEMGTDILISELVEFDDSAEYKFTITDPNGNEKDYTSRQIWIPEEIGKYTLTYTILEGINKGTATHVIEVLARKIEWSYDNFSAYIYQKGSTLQFSDLFDDMNVVVQSDCPYELSVVSVLVDGVRTDLTGKDSYTFESLSKHIFRFRVDTDDGQYSVATVSVGVQYIEESMEPWLEQNSITTHNYLTVLSDHSVSLNASSFKEKSVKVSEGVKESQLIMSNLSYLSFNGEYGVGDYVVFDFTGSNLPQLCFFVDQTSKELIDEFNGVYLANGFGTGKGSESKRYTYYGPWKIKGKVVGGSDRLRIETESPIGAQYLDENTRYRFVAGVSNVAEATYTKDDTTKWTGLCPTLRLTLVNLDTGEIVYDKEPTLTPMAQYGLTEEYYTGNIVAYAEVGETTKWDKIYPVFHGVEDSYDLIPFAPVRKNAAKTVKTNEELLVADYVEIPDGADYDLYYINANGVKTAVEGDTFTFSETGDYRMTYVLRDGGESKVNTIRITAKEMDSSVWSYLNEKRLRVYKAELDGENGVNLQKGAFKGKNTLVSSTDVPYVSFDGEYGVRDYVQFDFTGSNLPQLCFFVKETTPDLVDVRKDGVYVTNGFGKEVGVDNGRLTVYGPHKISGASFGGSNRLVTHVGAAIGSAYLNADTRYRYIAGISDISSGKVELQLILFDLDAGEYVYDEKLVADMTKFGLEDEYFSGNIVAYGSMSAEMVWDKIYPVQKNVIDPYKLVPLPCFKEDAPSVVKSGEQLNVSDYIEVSQGAEYELSYANAAGEETLIEGQTFTLPVGEWRLIYRLGDVAYAAEKAVSAQAMSATLWSFMKDNKINAYGAQFSGENDSVTLAAGSYTGADCGNTGTTDVSYLKFGGTYGVENFVAVDFTGNNMPNISLFNVADKEEKTRDISSGKGLFFTQGVLNKDGKMNSTLSQQYRLFAPTNFGGDAWSGVKNLLQNKEGLDGLTYAEMKKEENATKQYRLIIGVHQSEPGSLKYSVVLMQKSATGSENEYEIVCKSVEQNFEWSRIDGFDFNGSIVIYGRPYETTKLDRVHTVYGNIKTVVQDWTGTEI